MEPVESSEPNTNPDPNAYIRRILITVSFIVGAAGNIAALWILYKSARRRNKKHVFLLRCLATNDLVAQVGMFLLLLLSRQAVIPPHWTCAGFVLLRNFGLGSGCVAFVMALERWLALTRPFHYQQIVTYPVLKIFTICLWTFQTILCYLPLLGFGLYFKDEKCQRYRYATELKDKIYAYVFFIFGTTLCICIALCNLMVVWELSRIRYHGRVLVRRVSRSNFNNRIGSARYQTQEELAFAKLMAIICVIFCVCWIPQMVEIPIAQFSGDTGSGTLTKIADTLMCVYFTLDPFVYVLQRYMERGRSALPCCFCCCPKSNVSTNSEVVIIGTITPTSVLLNPPSFSSPIAR